MKDRLEFPQHLIERGLVREGVEVGVLFGEYSVHLLSNWPGRLHLVDPWVQQKPSVYLDGCNAVDMQRAFDRTRVAVAPFGDRARILRMFSVTAAKLFADNSLDFVYLDANHGEPSMAADLPAWLPKIRAGGILCGHDFYDRHDDWHDCGVESAVRRFAKERALTIRTTPCTSWWIDKP